MQVVCIVTVLVSSLLVRGWVARCGWPVVCTRCTIRRGDRGTQRHSRRAQHENQLLDCAGGDAAAVCVGGVFVCPVVCASHTIVVGTSRCFQCLYSVFTLANRFSKTVSGQC